MAQLTDTVVSSATTSRCPKGTTATGTHSWTCHVAVMIEHFLSMKARIYAIWRLVSLFESDSSKSRTLPAAL